MKYPSETIENSINEISKLPGIGKKTALRLVLFLLRQPESQSKNLANAISEMRLNVNFCKNCHNISDLDVCEICSNPRREQSVICVVEDIGDLWAIEKSKAFNGTYHVLGGVLSAMDGVGPDQLNIVSLLKRLESGSVKEVIIATNATTEGQITGQYIADECAKFKKLITRLPQGIPVGGELELIDYNTMSTAFTSRSEIK